MTENYQKHGKVKIVFTKNINKKVSFWFSTFNPEEMEDNSNNLSNPTRNLDDTNDSFSGSAQSEDCSVISGCKNLDNVGPIGKKTVIFVKGEIGVGKSWLLEDARQHYSIDVSTEIFNEHLLADYISDNQCASAYIFQIAMYQGSLVRQQSMFERQQCRVPKPWQPCCLRSVESSNYCALSRATCDQVCLVERGNSENAIFCLTQYVTGGIDKEHYRKYLWYTRSPVISGRHSVCYVTEEQTVPRIFCESHPTFCIYLWSPAFKQADNREKRGVECEQNYDKDKYLNVLSEMYFLDYISDVFQMAATAVFDWSEWGSYAQIKAFFENIVLNMSESERIPLVKVDQEYRDDGSIWSAKSRKEALSKNEQGQLVFDVPTYLALPTFQRVAIRDDFMKEIAIKPTAHRSDYSPASIKIVNSFSTKYLYSEGVENFVNKLRNDK